MSRPMVLSERHVLVDCDQCGTPQDINDGAHLFTVGRLRVCERCADNSEKCCDGCGAYGGEFIECGDGSYCRQCCESSSEFSRETVVSIRDYERAQVRRGKSR